MSNGNVEKAILAEMGKPQSGLIDRVTRNNQIMLHNYNESVERTCECRLMGCPQTFGITLIPNQVLYPKYCPDHRSEYRRLNFLRQFESQPALYRLETFRIISEPGSPLFTSPE